MTQRYFLLNGSGLVSDYGSTSGADVTVNSNITHYLHSQYNSTPASTHWREDNSGTSGQVSLAGGASISISHITFKAFPNSDTWETTGTETVVLNAATTYADLDVRVAIHRVNSSGTIQASGSFTSYQTFSSTSLTFNPTKPSWGTEAVTDRLAIEIQFTDTRSHGGAVAYALTLFTSYLDTNVLAPHSSGYAQEYRLTNNASDLSTYADGNYDMDTTGESGSSTIVFTSIANTASKTIGFITPSGRPNSAAWTANTEEQTYVLELAGYNGGASRFSVVGTAERLNSSGTLQESATASLDFQLASIGSSASYQQYGFSIPNKSWSSGATGDRLAIKFVITNNTGSTADFAIRLHDGTNQTGYFYSKVADSGGGTTYYETPAMSATGTASLSKSRTEALSLSFSGVGTNVLSKSNTFVRTLTPSGTGTNSLTKVSNRYKTLNQSATGTNTVVKKMPKTLTYSGTGTSSEAHANVFTIAPSMSATGTPTISQIYTAALTLAQSATGTNVLSKASTLLKALSMSATGTNTVVKKMPKTLNYSATGTNTVAKTGKLTKTASATGTASLSTILMFVQAIALTATGTLALGALKISKAISMAATGTLNLVKKVSLFLGFTATGTASESNQNTFVSSPGRSNRGGIMGFLKKRRNKRKRGHK